MRKQEKLNISTTNITQHSTLKQVSTNNDPIPIFSLELNQLKKDSRFNKSDKLWNERPDNEDYETIYSEDGFDDDTAYIPLSIKEWTGSLIRYLKTISICTICPYKSGENKDSIVQSKEFSFRQSKILSFTITPTEISMVCLNNGFYFILKISYLLLDIQELMSNIVQLDKYTLCVDNYLHDDLFKFQYELLKWKDVMNLLKSSGYVYRGFSINDTSLEKENSYAFIVRDENENIIHIQRIKEKDMKIFIDSLEHIDHQISLLISMSYNVQK